MLFLKCTLLISLVHILGPLCALTSMWSRKLLLRMLTLMSAMRKTFLKREYTTYTDQVKVKKLAWSVLITKTVCNHTAIGGVTIWDNCEAPSRRFIGLWKLNADRNGKTSREHLGWVRKYGIWPTLALEEKFIIFKKWRMLL